MADTSFAGESTALLAAFRLRMSAEENARKRAVRRSLAAVGVAILHLLFIILLIESEWMPGVHSKAQVQAPLMWLLLPQAAKAPKVNPMNPKKESPHGAPTTIVVPPIVKTPPQNNAIDLGLALGKALACGANSFEYLTPEGRAACRHQPWHFKYDEHGYIVLDANPRPVQQEKPRPSDIQTHERNTAPVCPKYIDPNAPCLSDIIPGGQP